MALAQQVTGIVFAHPAGAKAAFQQQRSYLLPFAELAARLRTGIEAAGLWVLHEIDPQAILLRGGYDIGAARQILFFHPRVMKRLLEADAAAILEVPLKFALLEEPDGSVRVSWISPAAAFARYGNPALSTLGDELEQMCDTIADAVHSEETPPGRH